MGGALLTHIIDNKSGTSGQASVSSFRCYERHRYTDLYYGDIPGGAPSRIASFEVDGVDYNFRRALPYSTGADGAPASLQIPAMTPATMGEHDRHRALLNGSLWEVQEWLPAVTAHSDDPTSSPREFGAGMMAYFTRETGQVFNSGCCEWITELIRGDEAIKRVTHNVLKRFSSASKPR